MGREVRCWLCKSCSIASHSLDRTPTPVVDRAGRVASVLAGQPGADYARALDEVFELFEDAGRQAGLQAVSRQGPQKRGHFPAFNRGVTMGMGSSTPVALQTGFMSSTLDRLVGHQAVRRMAAYQDAAFSLWAPRLYAEYQRTDKIMREKLPHLPRNFHSLVFAAAAFNLGGKVWTFKHRDFLNWPFGWCAITALGRYDPTRTGQLILWELKLVVDFPPAATVLIPSAVITHSNTPVADGDAQMSFTQYTAGPIFRWVENGCRTEKELEIADPARYAEMQDSKDTAYLRRLGNFSTIDELLDRIE
ncbi:hypothetical protein F5878DRAFT_530398 [Lentinula raphanica]|uniref:Uncharacterized protein n=1 Tax=Lentinula raphanica TaxID=153919 RepID=A0AA38PGF0_9AGAR|nr:hypothetical protein F5878DRAFT_530398 [Lentinula raphanica]